VSAVEVGTRYRPRQVFRGANTIPRRVEVRKGVRRHDWASGQTRLGPCQQSDLHDLRDTDTTRENYTAASRDTGIKRNRKSVLLLRSEIVAVARLDDVVDV
jgi:hypothetical protein